MNETMPLIAVVVIAFFFAVVAIFALSKGDKDVRVDADVRRGKVSVEASSSIDDETQAVEQEPKVGVRETTKAKRKSK